MSDKVPLYDEFSERYDVMVSWEERLAREEPFFRKLFDETEVHRVLDVGCATGGHVLHFAGMGLEAVGVDPSAEMVRLAKEAARGRKGASFRRAGFGELRARLDGEFDLLVCLGNTLPHAESPEKLRETVEDMASMLRRGGLLVIQQLNYDRILAEGRRFLGASSGSREGTEYLFFRFYDFEDPRLVFNVVTFKRPPGEPWGFRADSTRLLPIRHALLGEALAAAGFEGVRWHGGLSDDPFDPASSGDLVVVAARG